MTSQVYYRKWRPKTFSQLVGQEPIAHTLMQAVVRNRVAHAYLFAGPRGTGKTSTARILAKAVNCLEPQNGEPDDRCHICTTVNEGRALDLVEIDAASNRGIDEIRAIKEKINYSPVEAKYKVYVLDEAHMLTDAAGDALLKTLEEPPEHVIFILATTEPHRLSSTIVSRCQRFDFRRIPPAAMTERLAQICEAEDIKTDAEALQAMVRHAEGSLRDAENLLEQAVTSFGSPLELEQINLLLGLTASDQVRALIVHILKGDIPEAITLVNTVASHGGDLRQLHRQLVDQLREMLLVKSGAGEIVVQSPDVIEELSSATANVPVERLFRSLRIMGQINFRHDTPSTLPLELAIIECAREEPEGRLAQQETAAAPTVPAPTPQPQPARVPQPVVPANRETPAAEAPAEPPPQKRAPEPQTLPMDNSVHTTVEDSPSETSPSPAKVSEPQNDSTDATDLTEHLNREWEGIVRQLSRYKGRRFNLGALLRGCRQPRFDGNTLELPFSHRSHMERMQEEMDNPDSKRTFLDAISSALGITSPITLSFSATNGQNNRQKLQQSPLLQTALGMGGKILEETKEPSNE
ncbi:MAG: DNA polymerase III subunit gamma/tau [Chloroflexi bacterium]|nr:DNA polymerase III subunit gamma/tau [Chloroflexota bacterium]